MHFVYYLSINAGLIGVDRRKGLAHRLSVTAIDTQHDVESAKAGRVMHFDVIYP